MNDNNVQIKLYKDLNNILKFKKLLKELVRGECVVSDMYRKVAQDLEIVTGNISKLKFVILVESKFREHVISNYKNDLEFQLYELPYLPIEKISDVAAYTKKLVKYFYRKVFDQFIDIDALTKLDDKLMRILKYNPNRIEYYFDDVANI